MHKYKAYVTLGRMAKNLVIVESPAKARTIEKYLGKDFVVKSSFGHIRDLPKKGLNIDKEHGFEPTYEISSDKKKIVSELQKAAQGSDVWLASDEDREGEAIAWHLTQALKLNPDKTKRIVFHEITQPAIERAIKNPRSIDKRLVDAQQARRILDRLVGYELSPVLWKKVRPGLSAGRVQSVAVRLVVERERGIRDFKPVASYKVTAVFKNKSDEFEAELNDKLKDKALAKEFLEACLKATFTLSGVAQKPGTRSPGPPFTTSSLQQEASRRLGYGVRQTMTLAQRLYENGHITYMRTDSTILSNIAVHAFGDYIIKNFGKNYSSSRQYKTKSAGAQEAHEAIRPTDITRLEAGQDQQEAKLYKLIWKRALSSQMAAAQFERTEAVIDVSGRPEKFIAKGEVLTFDGFMKVYGNTAKDTLLPSLTKGEILELIEMTARQNFSRPVGRYSEATLVKKLEELGIGRPSTYAPTISTIQTRGYVEKTDVDGVERQLDAIVLKNDTISEETLKEITGADKNKLSPTSVAEVTTDFLVKYFPEIVDPDFTAHVEDDFDNIAEGKQAWVDMITTFYKNFHPLIERSEQVSRKETSQARELGKDPKTDKPVIARYGRFGPMLQIGEAEDDKKPTFAQMPENTTIENVTLNQALEMFKLPRIAGKTTDGREIVANFGRFGPYVQVDKLFAPIKPLDPMTITETQAREAIAKKEEQIANKYIQQFKNGVNIVNGPYGPYITDGKKNARIPKDMEPAKLTESEAKEILEKAPSKSKRRRRKTRTH